MLRYKALITTSILLASTVLQQHGFAKSPNCLPGVDCRPVCRIKQQPPECKNGSNSGAVAFKKDSDKTPHRGSGRIKHYPV